MSTSFLFPGQLEQGGRQLCLNGPGLRKLRVNAGPEAPCGLDEC